MAFTYKPYEDSDEYKQKAAKAAEYEAPYQRSAETQARYDAAEASRANKPGEYVNAYADLISGTRDKITNRSPFTYDVTSDALYQQYKDQYISGGRLAMADTMGQAAALTGGYGNSYAATAGNQAYQAYLQKLNDVVPQLYSMAYQRYQDEGNNLKDLLNMYENAEAKDYGRYGDNYNRWFTEQQYLDNLAANAENNEMTRYYTDRDYYTNLANTARQWDYGVYSDTYKSALQEYLQQVSEDQWNKTYELQKKSASGSPKTPTYDIKDIATVKSELDSRSSKASQRSCLESAYSSGFISKATYDDLYYHYDLYNDYAAKKYDGSYVYEPYNNLGSTSRKIERDGRLLK